MKKMEEISSKAWDYILYKKEDFILTVIFFGGIDYPRSFRISKEESEQNLEELSKKIRNNYDDFKDREIQPPITEVSTDSEEE